MSGHMDNSAYVEDFAARIVRRAGVRVGEVYEGRDLRALADLRATLDDAVRVAVEGMRAQGVSWQVIGDELGISRQAAHKTYAYPGRDVASDLRAV